ncbi:MAG: replication-associated recombination protein A [Oscillospiraceae bacterium]|jgi:putative ATPase|nr:replication-associated recombination protein A [Oscillospiraceae bacterium]
MGTPLAERLRPEKLEEVVGQRHLLEAGRPLRRIVESGRIPNLIFYGPSGVGKTTVARIIAQQADMRLHKLNGTSASTADLRAVVEEVGSFAGHNGILLYLDEIQYLNKKQQQSLLEYIEDGSVTLIASTTENPYFYIYNAVLSRCTVFEFKPVEPEDAVRAVRRAFSLLEEEYGEAALLEEGAAEQIARACGGDVRKAMNGVELCYLSAQPEGGSRRITLELARALAQRSAMRYDRQGDEHYDIISALQKSIRGSDENAALHYLARLLEAGDLLSACRRILVIACEDVGLAYPQAIPIVKACVDAATQLGLPEALHPLADAVILLATAPKSNSASSALEEALADVRAGRTGAIPRCLQNKHFDGEDAAVKGQFYKYPHSYRNHYVRQQYMPEALAGRVYYQFGENKNEQAARLYREKLLRESAELGDELN